MNRALLVGINEYPKVPLQGCVNDITDMADFLVQKCGFNIDEIRLLADTRATKANILERLDWLVTGLQSGDRVLFHFSGHGTQVPTRSKEGEVDGLDEAICPVDFNWSEDNVIRDKDFNRIFSVVPKGVEFIWISDSCHSGDLVKDVMMGGILQKFIIPPVDIQWRIKTAELKKIIPIGFQKMSSELNLAFISGCKSKEISADSIFGGKSNGALTYFLLQELKGRNGLTLPLDKLVKNINHSLKKNGFKQQPQLEGDKEIQNKPFLKV